MAKPAASVKRKVLLREDFGLCVLWPKTHWEAVGPPAGRVSVQVDGSPRRVRVGVEDCNCQGTGWHQHWFLCLPKALGASLGEVVTIQVGESELEAALVPTVSSAIDEINDATLFGKPLSKTRRDHLGKLLAGRQGLPGSYCGLFAPVADEIEAGYRVYTGESIRSGGGARHILGEEALRALRMLDGQSGRRGATLVSEAIERAEAEMGQRLTQQENRPSSTRGHYCCNRCSVALWRALAVGAFEDAEDRLASGLRLLRERRDEMGGWRGYEFSYTLSALIEARLDEAVAELTYARPAIERRLARRAAIEEPYGPRRRAVMEAGLGRIG